MITIRLIEDTSIAPAGAVLAHTHNQTLIVVDPSLSRAEQNELVRELLEED